MQLNVSSNAGFYYKKKAAPTGYFVPDKLAGNEVASLA